jgi:uncharacterized membrane protein YhfC
VDTKWTPLRPELFLLFNESTHRRLAILLLVMHQVLFERTLDHYLIFTCYGPLREELVALSLRVYLIRYLALQKARSYKKSFKCGRGGVTLIRLARGHDLGSCGLDLELIIYHVHKVPVFVSDRILVPASIETNCIVPS